MAKKITKRSDYTSWDEFYMGLALWAAQRSKDPNTQVGACIVDKDGYEVAVGYNGMPIGISDDHITWEREGKYSETKYAYVVHAEANALIKTRRDISGGTLYATMFPCNECAKTIANCHLKRVVYLQDKYHDDEIWVASRKIFDTCGIKYEAYQSTNRKFVIEV
ncbi:dCMP deaminase family protein [Candidatus Saccharibacteria bacterium]|nr:dCMP deaminase family protein [Candidatus Saccharibacteria bacterium]